MKRILKELKKYKYTTLAIILFVVLLIAGYFAYSAFFGSRGVPSYGNRLDGIDEVMPTNDEQNKVLDALKAIDEVKDANFSVSGRTINVIVTVSDATTTEKAKTIPSVVVANLASDQISYFDIQVFIKSEGENVNFPIIGYKGKDQTDISFSYSKTAGEA